MEGDEPAGRGGVGGDVADLSLQVVQGGVDVVELMLDIQQGDTLRYVMCIRGYLLDIRHNREHTRNKPVDWGTHRG